MKSVTHDIQRITGDMRLQVSIRRHCFDVIESEEAMGKEIACSVMRTEHFPRSESRTDLFETRGT